MIPMFVLMALTVVMMMQIFMNKEFNEGTRQLLYAKQVAGQIMIVQDMARRYIIDQNITSAQVIPRDIFTDDTNTFNIRPCNEITPAAAYVPTICDDVRAEIVVYRDEECLVTVYGGNVAPANLVRQEIYEQTDNHFSAVNFVPAMGGSVMFATAQFTYSGHRMTDGTYMPGTTISAAYGSDFDCDATAVENELTAQGIPVTGGVPAYMTIEFRG